MFRHVSHYFLFPADRKGDSSIYLGYCTQVCGFISQMEINIPNNISLDSRLLFSASTMMNIKISNNSPSYDQNKIDKSNQLLIQTFLNFTKYNSSLNVLLSSFLAQISVI